MATKIKLGKYANIFHDQYTGITLRNKEVIELNALQLKSPRIQMALQGGHLVYASTQDTVKSTPSEDVVDVNKFVNAFESKVQKGKTVEKIVGDFNRDQLTLICKELNIEIEEGDKDIDLAEAIYSVFLEKNSK